MASGKFQGQGINYNAKMIGVEEVGAARGEQMCQNAITHLKQSIASGEHKHKVIVNISLDGVRLVDLKTNVSILLTIASSCCGIDVYLRFVNKCKVPEK